MTEIYHNKKHCKKVEVTDAGGEIWFRFIYDNGTHQDSWVIKGSI